MAKPGLRRSGQRQSDMNTKSSDQQAPSSPTTDQHDTIPSWVEVLKKDIIVSLKDELKSIVENGIQEITSRVEVNLTKTVDFIIAENKSLIKRTESLETQLSDQKIQIDILRSTNHETIDRLCKLESFSMQDNLIFTGIANMVNEDEHSIRASLASLFEEMGIEQNIQILRCHRMGRNTPRDIVVRLVNTYDKREILRASKNLKGRDAPIYINEQYPHEIEQKRRVLRPIMRKSNDLGKRAMLVQDKLLIEGKPYYTDTIKNIPFDISDLSSKSNRYTVVILGKTFSV